MRIFISLVLACALLSCATPSVNSVSNMATNPNDLKAGTNDVSFSVAGENIAGLLFLPDNFSADQTYPTVVVDGSWTTVKEQMQSNYASRLAKAGYVALAFDHRFYGESGGQPREYEDHERKVEDLRASLDYLETLPFVDTDRLAGLGVCASGAYMLDAAGRDDRFKSLGTVAAWLMTPETAKQFYGGDEGTSERIAKATAAREKFEQTGQAAYTDAYNPNNPEAAMFFPVEYYAKKSRGNVPSWNNNFAVMSWDRWLTYDGIDAASKVTIPVIMVHSEKAFLPDGVRSAYEQIKNDRKELVWMNDYEHDQFYDNPTVIDKAMAEITDHFAKTL